MKIRLLADYVAEHAMAEISRIDNAIVPTENNSRRGRDPKNAAQGCEARCIGTMVVAWELLHPRDRSTPADVITHPDAHPGVRP
jgi:hypothetical protein